MLPSEKFLADLKNEERERAEVRRDSLKRAAERVEYEAIGPRIRLGIVMRRKYWIAEKE